ncbi:nitrite reductase small subunit NirD [Castellaniella defragrans]|uniref:Nitrite reductase [NAD(P)H] small subunit n=1 Tax=Castellaniella defragrans (strain DSM 12143 / CCUG 39792 / 65Phen) TaxID=1437824 RepID=W8X600_CASD6|nr:nitrite reductase small subunit NirD [Castellaniella defragrans]CDM26072.1 Nitrite reductase [NAD(P)H] small subunit [Castellaniella defragrans 65Phen]
MKPSTHRRAKGADHQSIPYGTPRLPEPFQLGSATAGDAPVQDGATDADWQPVCRLEDLIPDAGVAVRAHGAQVAVFLTDAGPFALDHVDPFCGAAVLARGIVGELQGHPVVASPMYKQHFRLDTGQCLEDERVRVRRWPLRMDADGVLRVGRPETIHPLEADHASETTA